MLFRTKTTNESSVKSDPVLQLVAQNTTKAYLDRPVLQALLEKLFPPLTEFHIEVILT